MKHYNVPVQSLMEKGTYNKKGGGSQSLHCHPPPSPMLSPWTIVDEPPSLGTSIPLSMVLFHYWSVGRGSKVWSVGRGCEFWSVGRGSKVWSFGRGSKFWSVGHRSKVWSFWVQVQACPRDTFRQHVWGLPRFKTRKALKGKKSPKLLDKINCWVISEKFNNQNIKFSNF